MAKKEPSVTYCIATFYLNIYGEERQLVDENAILSKLTTDEIEIVSKYKIGQELIKSISISIVDGRNAYLIINGPVLKLIQSEKGYGYLVKAPQITTKTLPNGTVLKIECVAISKYCNIHKPKRKKKEECDKT